MKRKLRKEKKKMKRQGPLRDFVARKLFVPSWGRKYFPVTLRDG